MQRVISWTRVLSVVTAIIVFAGVVWVVEERQRPARAFSSASVLIERREAVRGKAKWPVLLAATAARSLHGLVRTRAGRALAGATVCLVNASGEVRISGACIETGPAGEFGFSEPPSDARAVLASLHGYQAHREALGPATPSLEFVIELDAAEESLAGSVVDASGGFVTGALVTLRGKADAAIAVTSSALDGRFEMAISPGAVEVCAQAEAYSRTCSALGAPSEEHLLILTPESRIVGRVRRRADGSGIAGASVIASNRNGLHIPTRRTSSGDDGTFSLDALPAGGYEVVAVSEDSRTVEQWVALGLGETSVPVTLWAAPAVRISGLIRVAGAPCPSGRLDLSGPVWTQGVASDDGSVDLDGIVPGRYEATAHCDGAVPQIASLDIEAEPIEHVFDLEELIDTSSASAAAAPAAPSGGIIHVSIEAEPSAALAVFAESADGALRAGQRRGSEFVFEKALIGEYRVYLNDDVEHAQRVRISREGTAVYVRLKAAAPAWIRGRVTSDDGAPAADAWVRASRSDLLPAPLGAPPILTDADGRFSLAAVPGVPYMLMVASPFGDAQIHGVETGQEVLVRVLAAASLAGRVQTAQGGPVPEFTLLYRAEHASSGYALQARSSIFNLSMLEPNTYTLQVTSPLGTAFESVRLGPGDAATVTLTLSEAKGSGTDQPTSALLTN
jgi:hypothetical protein